MTIDRNITIVSDELQLKPAQVEAVSKLLADDATVPFISRYRKEATGQLDEVAVIAIRDRLAQLEELDKRREAILKSLNEQEKLTPELEEAVNNAQTLSKLEDIYLPYRPKRRTKGTVAKEKGLEPLAELLFKGDISDIQQTASEYISDEKGVNSTEEALEGARHIISEWINEDAQSRENMRNYFLKNATMTSSLSGKETDEAMKYKDYFEWSEKANDAPSHRILALLRGADEGHLTVHFMPDEDAAAGMLEQKFATGEGASAEQVKLAARDAYKRLMGPSMETELRSRLKKQADEEAIRVFAENVRELFLASPMGEKATLAVDPGLRTGCKVVTLSKQGNLLHTDTIYPLAPHNKTEESAAVIRELCQKYRIEAIAVGNGTGGREALAFCKNLGLENIIITMVNESGASVYSASEVARKEFPGHDLTVRGAVSIGRRLMDPLAELVKIDPRSIGVGQYQHDVDQKELKKTLDDVVSSCVNAVGVEVNTASGELLRYVSGLSSRMADEVVSYRNNNGPFTSRQQILKVPGMGPKSFQQSAGFLRIVNAEHPLDASAVHPESYHIVEKMAADLGCSVKDLMTDRNLREQIVLSKYVTDNVGMPTLQDIYNELDKPGRDPRREFELFNFREDVNAITDLEEGMTLPGVITNVTAFGAFVDVGVHQDGLVHISHLSDDYVSDPHKTVKVNQKVTVTVMEVDVERKRISLSMKQNPNETRKKTVKKPRPQKKAAAKKKGNTGNNKKEHASSKPESPFSGLKDLLDK
ncbi:MAG: Tex family protein [Spirochaetota bacterium]